MNIEEIIKDLKQVSSHLHFEGEHTDLQRVRKAIKTIENQAKEIEGLKGGVREDMRGRYAALVEENNQLKERVKELEEGIEKLKGMFGFYPYEELKDECNKLLTNKSEDSDPEFWA